MMTAMRTFTRLPSIQNGYEIDDQFSVVVPIARTNLVINPSFETNTTSWTAIGGSIARSTLFQYHGAYSLAITPTAATTDGARFDTVLLIAGTAYAYSAKVLGIAGRSYKLAIETTAGVELTSVTFVASGRWQWVWGYWNENSTTTRRLTLRKAGGTDVLVFYIDGVQVEAIVPGETVSTYLDGDQQGFVPNQSPVPYFWNGTPHASTSARSGLTRAGGMVVKFKDFGFLLTAIIGLGLAVPANIVTEYARIDGGYDSYTRKPSRQFTLSGQFQGGMDYLQLRQYRGGLARLFDRDLIGQDQRLLLRREVVDPCGNVQSSVCQIIGKYQGGMQGNTDNQVAEQAALTFTQYMPNVLADGESGGALDVQDSVSNANGIMKRSPAGAWSALGTTGLAGGTAESKAILIHPNGFVYVGGSFTSAGASGADHMARYDPATNTFANIAGSDTTFNALIRDLARHPDGRIVLVGDFTNASGIGAADFVAVLDPTANTVAALGTGANAQVLACAVDQSGRIFAGGANTTDFGGVANTNGIGYWDGAAWNAMGTGLNNGSISSILPIGTRIYVGGSFTQVNSVTDTSLLAYYDFADSLWHSVFSGAYAPGIGGAAGPAVQLPNGQILIIGNFTMIDGVTAENVALFNGVSFAPIGSGPDAAVQTAALNPLTGMPWIGGSFTSINGVTIASPFAQLVGATALGATIVGPDITLPGTPKVAAIAFAPDGTLYIGFNTSGTATSAGSTTITNPGTARAYPTIVINGPSTGTARIWSIVNTATNRAIYLNLTLNAGEVATLVFTPDNLSFTSTFQGNIASTILPGSNTADFFLSPGVNNIASFSASSTVVATWYARPAFVSMDDVP